MKTKTEYDRFEDLAKGVLNVPHSEVKAKLDAEKRAKRRKKSSKSEDVQNAGKKRHDN
jgi:hypothetical protein